MNLVDLLGKIMVEVEDGLVGKSVWFVSLRI